MTHKLMQKRGSWYANCLNGGACLSNMQNNAISVPYIAIFSQFHFFFLLFPCLTECVFTSSTNTSSSMALKFILSLQPLCSLYKKRTTWQNKHTQKTKKTNPASNTAVWATYAPVAILGWSLATQPTDITCVLLAWVCNLGLVIWDFNKSGP